LDDKSGEPEPQYSSGHLLLALGAAVGEVAVTKNAGIIVLGNVSRCYQQPGENIRFAWRYGRLILMPLGFV